MMLSGSGGLRFSAKFDENRILWEGSRLLERMGCVGVCWGGGAQTSCVSSSNQEGDC